MDLLMSVHAYMGVLVCLGCYNGNTTDRVAYEHQKFVSHSS